MSTKLFPETQSTSDGAAISAGAGPRYDGNGNGNGSGKGDGAQSSNGMIAKPALSGNGPIETYIQELVGAWHTGADQKDGANGSSQGQDLWSNGNGKSGGASGASGDGDKSANIAQQRNKSANIAPSDLDAVKGWKTMKSANIAQ